MAADSMRGPIRSDGATRERGGDFPNLGQVIIPGRYDAIAIWAETSVKNIVVMSEWICMRCATAGVPYLICSFTKLPVFGKHRPESCLNAPLEFQIPCDVAASLSPAHTPRSGSWPSIRQT